MSYREENGHVILTMSREDYEELDSALKLVIIFEDRLLRSSDLAPIVGNLRDRLNQDNPNYRPYRSKP